MNIILITQYYKPEMGAPQNRLEEMVLGLKALGNKINIVAAMPNYPTGKIFDKYRGIFRIEESIENIPILRYWIYASNSKKIFPRILSMFSFSLTVLASLFKLRKLNPDYIIVESPPLTLPFSALILAKLTGAKLVMNVSDLWPLSAKELGVISEGFFYKRLEGLEKYLYNKSEICMGQSQEIIDYIANRTNSSTFLFRNGVDPKRFQSCKNKQISKSDGKLRIVYAGLIGFAQGILDICKNIDFNNLNMEFHIYGDGGESEDLKAYTESQDKGIIYHGRVSANEIPSILARADFTLIPLVKNIFGAVPSKIYESMAAGTPIIFAGEGEGKRIIEEYGLGWTIPAKKYDALEQTLLKISNIDLEQIQEIQRNCIYCAHNVFNRPAQVKALNDFMLKHL